MTNGPAEDVKSFLGCHGDAGTVENLRVMVGSYTPVLEFSCYMTRGGVSSDIQAPVFFLRYDATRSGALLPVDWAKAAAGHFGTEDGVSTTGARVTYHAEALSGLPIMAISSDPDELEAVNAVLAHS
ncbi:hypothetical protein [Embleya sp. MST-111070]|uniref:hypothetical protein n=1 Tax=Embleya sp. MST-111070 TaxID=3398231 RepID=UPI003F741F19